jgi:hypothetical protein
VVSSVPVLALNGVSNQWQSSKGELDMLNMRFCGGTLAVLFQLLTQHMWQQSNSALILLGTYPLLCGPAGRNVLMLPSAALWFLVVV